MPKLVLTAHGTAHGPGHDPRTDHLRPVIEFLLAQGNQPAGGRSDAFSFDQGGEGHYTFTDPIDAAQLRAHFVFPASIQLDEAGTLRDGLNRVDIAYAPPRARFSFELGEGPRHEQY